MKSLCRINNSLAFAYFSLRIKSAVFRMYGNYVSLAEARI